ncbi:hypothetical protein D9M69_600250 [compost metagenome]
MLFKLIAYCARHLLTLLVRRRNNQSRFAFPYGGHIVVNQFAFISQRVNFFDRTHSVQFLESGSYIAF